MSHESIERKREDLLLALFSVFVKRGRTHFYGQALEDSFGSALESLEEESLFLSHPSFLHRWIGFYEAVMSLQASRFCYWVSPHFTYITIIISPRDAERILKEAGEKKSAIEKAADAWMKKYNEML